MAYEVVFPSERVERAVQKILDRIPAEYQAAVVEAIRALGANLRPKAKRTKRLKGQVVISRLTAGYRLRIGPYRILYDIDDARKKVILLTLLRRDEHTYNQRLRNQSPEFPLSSLHVNLDLHGLVERVFQNPRS